jgi:hypothetical protein
MLPENAVKPFLVLGILSLSAGLPGCGISHAPIATNTTPGIPTIICGVSNSGPAYLFFGTLDTSCPGKPATVDAGTDVLSNIFNPAWVFLAGTYDSATPAVTDVHNYAMVYANKNGHLYKTSALQNSGAPTPTQLSNVSDAETICSTTVAATDFANPDNSQIVYQTPGSNSSCFDNDDIYKMVRLGMGSSDVPVSAKQPIGTALHDWSTGTISGWLVKDANDLKRCDANFANCSTSLLPNITYASQLLIAGSNRWLLEVDHVVYVYDGDANTLSAITPAIDGVNRVVTGSATDGGNFYFVTSKEPKSIYVAPVVGSVKASKWVSDTTNNIIGFTLSANTLLYWTNTGITKVAKSDGSATTLIAGNFAGVAAVNGKHVYYTYTDSNATLTAGMIDDDDGNTRLETANAGWRGFVTGTAWNLTDGFAATNQIQTLIRADGYNAVTGFAGATLRSFNTATTAEVAVLGTLPADTTGIGCSSLGANALCTGSTPTGLTDIFSLNAETSGSLQRVTSTPTKNEFPFY